MSVYIFLPTSFYTHDKQHTYADPACNSAQRADKRG